MDQPSWTFLYVANISLRLTMKHSWWSRLAKRRIFSCIDNYQRLPWNSMQFAAHRCKTVRLDNFMLILCWNKWWCYLAKQALLQPAPDHASSFHDWIGLTKAVNCAMAWMKEAAPRFYRKRRWMKKKKSVVLSHQGSQSNFCVLRALEWVCRGKNRKDHTNQHLHGCITAAEPALESEHLEPKKYTYPPQPQSTQQTLHYKQTRSPTTIYRHGHLQTIYTHKKKTSMRGDNAYGHKQIDAWLHR